MEKDPEEKVLNEVLKTLQKQPEKGCVVMYIPVRLSSGGPKGAEKLAANMATEFNLGLNKYNTYLPAENYCAIFALNSHSTSYEIIVFDRRHTPSEWEDFVHHPEKYT